MTSPDRGRPEERTTMAWQRTALALAASAAVLARLTVDTAGLAAVLALGVALPLSAWVLVESRRRSARSRPRGGRFPTALAVATVAVAGAELASLAARW